MTLEILWDEFLAKSADLDKLRRPLLADHGEELVAVLKRALMKPHMEGAAFDVLGYLHERQRLSMLPELLQLACGYHRYSDLARREILSLPRAQVLQQVEMLSEPILKRAGEEEFSLLVQLYRDIDTRLAEKLVGWGAQHDNAQIRAKSESMKCP